MAVRVTVLVHRERVSIPSLIWRPWPGQSFLEAAQIVALLN